MTDIARRLTLEQMEEWARLTSDFNPMHLDPEFTRQTAYGRPIVFATLTLAIVAEALEREFGRQWTEGGVLDVRFVGPVMVGDEFAVSATTIDGSPSVECRTAGSAPLVLALNLAKQD